MIALIVYTILFTIASYYFYLLTGEANDNYINYGYHGYLRQLSDANFNEFISILSNNIQVVFSTLIYGIIFPIFIFPYVYHFNSFSVLGEILAIEHIKSDSPLQFF